LWNNIAINTCEYCHVGDVVGIKGRLQTRSYEDENKEKKFIMEVIAEKVTFLSSNTKNREISEN
jgi:single-strand DNA-binding protein